MKGLILAGGHGTRLRPLTYSGNKHMLPVANKPILMYGIETLRDAGITEIGIILGPIREGVQELFGTGEDYGIQITYIDQLNPLGLPVPLNDYRKSQTESLYLYSSYYPS